MPGQAGPFRVKYMPVTGGQLSALLYRRALSPVPAEQRPHSALFSCTARLAACTAAGAPSVRSGSCRTPVCTYRERPHSALFCCTARLAACAAAGAPSVQPGSCRILVCIRRADTLYQKNSAKPTAFFRRGAKRRALKIYLTHSARRGTLKAAIFYIFWEGVS